MVMASEVGLFVCPYLAGLDKKNKDSAMGAAKHLFGLFGIYIIDVV